MEPLDEYCSESEEKIALKIQTRIKLEPGFEAILYKMLDMCKEAKTLAEIETEVISFPQMKVVLQTPQILLSWLFHCGGIKELSQEEHASMWITTPAGLIALEKDKSVDKLEELFMNEPEYKPIYLCVLEFCKKARSLMDIETLLADNELMENPKIYPNYFINTLEKTGSLVWDGHWATTQSALVKLS